MSGAAISPEFKDFHEIEGLLGIRPIWHSSNLACVHQNGRP